MTAEHIEYTWEVKKADSCWELKPAYTITVMARPNDRENTLLWVKKWVADNADRSKPCAFVYTLRNADLPCYDDDAFAGIKMVGIVVHKPKESAHVC